MALSADEKKLMEELLAKSKEPDADDFEIEIFDGSKGARIPFSQGSKWLFETFGIGEGPPPPPAGDGGGQGDGGQGAGATGPRSYFGKKQGAA